MPPEGYGEPGAGKWMPGMTWQSWDSSGSSAPAEAMRLSAVFACLRLLSESVATLPLDVFRSVAGTRVEVDKPGFLRFDPPRMTQSTYFGQVMMSLLCDGNAFIATVRNELGEVIWLAVLDPTAVTVKATPQGIDRYFVGGKEYGWLDIMHIRGMTLPGQVRGVSPLKMARDVVTGGRRAQDFGTSFMANSAMPPAVIEIPDSGEVGNEAQEKAKRIAKTWQDTHGGSGNAGKVGVLLGGAKLTTIAISPDDAQWLDSKRFSVSEIARFYGVPPHLIADASNSTSWGSGLAEQNLAFAQYSLQPWVTRIEEAHSRLLVGGEFVKLNIDARLRPSIADRFASYASGIDAGHLTINEARRLEDRPPVPWGDTPLTPSTPGAAA